MKRDERFRDSYMLAGWLFADLMLALALLFFASNTVGTAPEMAPTPSPTIEVTETPLPTHTPTSTPIPSPTPQPTSTPTVEPTTEATPTPSPTPCVEQVSLHDPLNSELKLQFTYGEPIPVDQVRQAYSEAFAQGKRAGLVITFGASLDPYDRDPGRQFAEGFNSTLSEDLGPVFTPDTVYLAYWEEGSLGSVTVKVYFIASTCV